MRSLILLVPITLAVVAAAVAQPLPPTDTVDLEDADFDASSLRVHFIDVGAGMAVLVETPGDALRIFIDGGKAGRDELEAYLEHTVEDKRIDIAIVTHADYDHIRGMIDVFADYDVGEFWYTGYESRVLADATNWNKLKDAVAAEGTTVFNPIGELVAACDEEVFRGGRGSADDVRIQFLNVDALPPARDPASGRSFSESQRRNNASLVFKLSHGSVSYLFTGDVNGRSEGHEGREHDAEIDSEEAEMVRRFLDDPDRCDLGATVLQLAHHGSNGSTSLLFLAAVNPEWVVVPAGSAYNHPHPETLRRVERLGIPADHVLRTDEGDATPEVDGVDDPEGDDCLVFESDGTRITRILRVSVTP